MRALAKHCEARIATDIHSPHRPVERFGIRLIAIYWLVVSPVF